MKKKISRRSFLGGTAGGVASFSIVPRYVLGGPGYTSPNEKLNIAGIGAGGRANGDLRGVRSENIVALCDVDENQAVESRKRWPKARFYQDFRKMLDKEAKNIDAVVVATPDHSHAVAAMAAMQLGKHAYVEKPLTHSIYEARVLAETARKYNLATQMGNQGHSGNGVRQICEMVWSGAIGPVREAHIWTNRPVWPQGIDRPSSTPRVPDTLDWDVWIGPAPERPYHPAYHPFKWRGWWDFGCGSLGDMGCHIMDPANWALKLCPPISVELVDSSPRNDETAPKWAIIRYEFPARGDMPALTMYWYDGGKLPPRPPEVPADEKIGDGNNGSMFIGDKGIICAGEYGGNPRLLPASKMKEYEMPAEIIPRIPRRDHHRDWIQACKGGEPACSNFDYAGPFTEIVLLGNLAGRVGEKLYWDAANMKVTNVDEANQWVKREYRQGWSL